MLVAFAFVLGERKQLRASSSARSAFNAESCRNAADRLPFRVTASMTVTAYVTAGCGRGARGRPAVLVDCAAQDFGRAQRVGFVRCARPATVVLQHAGV